MLTSLFLVQLYRSPVVFCSLRRRRLCESPSYTLPSSWYRRGGIVARAGTASHRHRHRRRPSLQGDRSSRVRAELYDGLACPNRERATLATAISFFREWPENVYRVVTYRRGHRKVLFHVPLPRRCRLV